MARALAIPLAMAAVLLAGCGSSHHAASAPAQPAAATPRCATYGLQIWIGLGEGGGTAGSIVYPLELTNISGSACHLRGFPGVSAWSGHRLGRPARRDHVAAARTVTLASGHTAHALVSFRDIGNFPPSRCAPKTAVALRVYPPDERSSRFVPYSFRACSKPGPTFLTVRPIEPGLGIPGFSR